MPNTLQYRPNVGIVIFNSDKKIWIGKRIDNNSKEAWQLPQGGIDYQEEPLNAAIREVYEETGITTIKNIGSIDNWIKYNLPLDIAKNKWGGKYIGQKQKWYLFYFYGDENEININISKQPEFSKWKWADEEYVKDNVTNFRKDVYKKVFQSFSKVIKKYT
jgi:putative (di)nucleoside polyphosphate hydrolase